MLNHAPGAVILMNIISLRFSLTEPDFSNITICPYSAVIDRYVLVQSHNFSLAIYVPESTYYEVNFQLLLVCRMTYLLLLPRRDIVITQLYL